jgi:hypothetical protein
MPTSGPLDFLPLWGLFLATLVLARLAVEAGHQLGQYRRRRSAEEKEAPVGAMIAATLGLLGLILAFTFGLAASRFDARRQIVVEEANSIGTTYLRAGLLPDGSAGNFRKLLVMYVDERLEAVRTGNIDRGLRRTDELHKSLWKEAEAVGQKHPNSIVVGLFIQSLNETIDVHSKRVLVGLQSRLPGILWGTLYLIALSTMAGVGYQEGLSQSRRSLAIIVLVVTFTAVLTLVADLDRPGEGLLRVSQQAMIDLRNLMSTYPESTP